MPKSKVRAFQIVFTLAVLMIPLWLLIFAGTILVASIGVPAKLGWFDLGYPVILMVLLPLAWMIRNQNPRISIWISAIPVAIMVMEFISIQVFPNPNNHTERFTHDFLCSDGSRVGGNTIAGVTQIYITQTGIDGKERIAYLGQIPDNSDSFEINVSATKKTDEFYEGCKNEKGDSFRKFYSNQVSAD